MTFLRRFVLARFPMAAQRGTLGTTTKRCTATWPASTRKTSTRPSTVWKQGKREKEVFKKATKVCWGTKRAREGDRLDMSVCEWVFSGHVAANSNKLEKPVAFCLGMTKPHICMFWYIYQTPLLICAKFSFTSIYVFKSQEQKLFFIVLIHTCWLRIRLTLNSIYSNQWWTWEFKMTRFRKKTSTYMADLKLHFVMLSILLWVWTCFITLRTNSQHRSYRASHGLSEKAFDAFFRNAVHGLFYFVIC